MSRLRVLVAGGAGFLGSHICESLIDEGFSVTCVDNLSTGSLRNLTRISRKSQFQFVHADVTAWPPGVDAVDYVLNFASPASPLHYQSRPVETLRVNAIGTENLLAFAMARGARFIQASTSEVYGDPVVNPQPESYWGNVNPIGPRAVYDEGKRYAEALITAYSNTLGLECVIARIFNTYGPRMMPNDGRAVPTFIRQSLLGQSLTVAGDGSQTRSLCYVDDVVRAILSLMDTACTGPINIGSDDEIAILDLARRIRDLCGSESLITFVPPAPDDPTKRKPVIARAKSVIGWSPQISLDLGLRRTIEWFNNFPELSDYFMPPSND